MTTPKVKILFLCTGNSCRSQMAKSAPDAESALACYRRVRDEIKAFVLTLPGSLNQRIHFTTKSRRH